MMGKRQQQIIDALTARGGSLVVEALVQELAPVQRSHVVRALASMAAAGLVTVAGKRQRIRPASLVTLAGYSASASASSSRSMGESGAGLPSA